MKITIAYLFTILSLTLTGFAADGDFDTATFNNPSGFRTTDIGGTTADSGQDVIVQADGKIVVIGRGNSRYCVIRYNADGSLDTTFSGDGIFTSTTTGSPTSGAVQSDGKIIVAGLATANTALLFRLNADGSTDNTFDTDGQVTTNFGGTQPIISTVLVQPDGKIVAVGTRNTGAGFPNILDIIIARYNPNGSLDSSFDGDGILISEPTPGRTQEAEDAVLTPNGKILVAGWQADVVGFATTLLVRYNVDGSLDPMFDGDGWLTTDVALNNNDYALSVALTRTGGIVVGGQYGGGEMDPADASMLRYFADGALDTSFDGDGMLLFPNNNRAFTDVLVQGDGKIIAYMSPGLVKLNTNGSFDTSFSLDGNVTVSGIVGLALQTDGKIVITGTQTITGNNTGVYTARLLNTGLPFTAATATISGRVTDEDGAGIRNATVIITGGSLEAPVFARTSSFGYYTFEGLRVGETYVATVSSKRYIFEPRIFTLNADLADLDFVAHQEPFRLSENKK